MKSIDGALPSESGGACCPVCESGQSSFFARIDGYSYFRCAHCGSLHIDNATLDAIDNGQSTRVYDETYWSDELKAACERADGESLVRAGEAILYARRPVNRFLDVGAGPGYLLDGLAHRFPSRADVFYGVELFPPDEHSGHPNYLVGKVGDLAVHFDAGVCIEVVEHLTPRMLADLAGQLAKVSRPRTLWLFNTGMPELVLSSDPGYLDPLRRGHIVSYGLPGIRHIFEPYGFRISQVPGKDYAWVAEFDVDTDEPDFDQRVTHPLTENKRLLDQCPLLYQAAFESARSSLNWDLVCERSRWAIDMEHELNTARAMYSSLQTEHNGIAKWAHQLQADLAELGGRHAALQVEHEGVARWGLRLQSELDVLRDQFIALQAEHADVVRRARGMEGEMVDREAQYRVLEHQLEAMMSSRSWRLTGPLRRIHTVLRRWVDSKPRLQHRDESNEPHD